MTQNQPSFKHDFSFLEHPSLDHAESIVGELEVAFLFYRTPSTEQIQNFRTILSEHIAYFTTLEALQAWWGQEWTSWTPIAVQKRIQSQA